jgi:parvulin-like peptidyl-prolyl isomerase
MRPISIVYGVILPICLFLGMPAAAQQPAPRVEDVVIAQSETAPPEEMRVDLTVPLLSPAFDRFPVAEVNGEPITLGELNRTLAASHERRKETETKAKPDYRKVLDRLVNVKLLLQESEKIGIDEMPEVRESVNSFSRTAAVQVLLTDFLRKANVKLDESEAERVYKQNVREYKIRSIYFKKEENAKKVDEELKAGKEFEEAADRAIAGGIAQGSREAGYVKLANVQPEAAAAVSAMAVGSISPVVKVMGGFVIVKLEEIRYPENQEEREKARKAVLTGARLKALEEYKQNLIRKYAKADKKLVGSIDFESRTPGFEKLLKDKRTVVRIKEGKPVTVSEWAKAIQARYFHGVALASESKKINRRKVEVLDELVVKKLLEKEASKTGILKTEEYKAMVDEHRESLIFGTFLQKVIYPDVKISQEEIDAYYKDHPEEFTTPEMVRLDSIAFGKMETAEAVLGKLQKGSDFKWMKDNADGQLPADTKGLLELKGNVVTTSSLPEEVGKGLSGAGEGDYRLYLSPEGYAYVLYVQGRVPATRRPMEEVREAIASKVHDVNFRKTADRLLEMMRKASEIRIYLADHAAKSTSPE